MYPITFARMLAPIAVIVAVAKMDSLTSPFGEPPASTEARIASAASASPAVPARARASDAAGPAIVETMRLAGAAGSQTYAVAVRDVAPVDLQSSCTAEAIPDVNRGAAFLLALAPLDARRAFERALELDPDCAMAGWGRAMSWLPGDPRRFDDLARREGRDAVRRAASAPAVRVTARERRYVASAAVVFDPPAGTPPLQRLQRYRDAMRDLAAAFPDDAVATTMSARASLMLSTVPDDDDQREAASIIERRLGSASARFDSSRFDSSALGAALTLLLARDRPGGASLGRPAADEAARLATLPLARHLPARIYTRLGEWAAAAASTEAAIKLAGSPVSPELVYGAASSAAVDGGAGASASGEAQDVAAEWLVEAYLQQGRVADASRLIEAVRRGLEAGEVAEPAAAAAGPSSSPPPVSPGRAAVEAGSLVRSGPGARAPAASRAGSVVDSGAGGAEVVRRVAGERRAIAVALTRMQARFVLARADWKRGLESESRAQGCGGATAGAAAGAAAGVAGGPVAAPSGVVAPCTFMHAFSAARLAWPGAQADRIADAARLSDRLDTSGAPTVPELLRVLVRAAMAAGQEEHPELELLATYAADLEERLLRSGQLVLPLAPAQELLGDLFLQANRFEQARSRYRSALGTWPNRPRPLLGLARASVRLDDREAATAAYRQLLSLWTDADPNLPELAEARRWLEAAAKPAAQAPRGLDARTLRALLQIEKLDTSRIAAHVLDQRITSFSYENRARYFTVGLAVIRAHAVTDTPGVESRPGAAGSCRRIVSGVG